MAVGLSLIVAPVVDRLEENLAMRARPSAFLALLLVKRLYIEPGKRPRAL